MPDRREALSLLGLAGLGSVFPIDSVGALDACEAALRLSTPYYLRRKDVDRFLAAFDDYRAKHKA